MHGIASSAWVKGHLTQYIFPKKTCENVCTENTQIQKIHWIHNVCFFTRWHTAQAVTGVNKYEKSGDMQKKFVLLQKSYLPSKPITKDRDQSWLMMAGDTRVGCTQSPPRRMITDLRGDSLCFALQNDSTGTDYNKPNIGCACHTMSDSRCILKDK